MRRSAILFIILALGVCVSACGTRATSSSQSNMVLTVTRTPLGSSTPVTFDKTVTNASAVQRLYRAALALPKAGGQSCPTTTEGYVRQDYHLAFQEGSSYLLPMTLRDWGCGNLFVGSDDVRGANDVRRTDETFMDLFAQTMSVAPSAL
jgi:hypothetical protein